jgi:hypothetical protein
MNIMAIFTMLTGQPIKMIGTKCTQNVGAIVIKPLKIIMKKVFPHEKLALNAF